MRFKSIGIAVSLLCSLCLFGLVLTPCVFAQLSIDSHIATEIVDHDGNTLVSAYVSIDDHYYDSGDGVVNLNGTFYVHNYDEEHDITYDGELRLEITDMDGSTFKPDSKTPVSGFLKKNDENARWWQVYDSISKNTNLHVDCLTPSGFGQDGIEAGENYSSSAIITLNVYGERKSETWTTSHSYEFRHQPEEDVDLIVGLGPTRDGETFSDDCVVNSNRERESWQSLLYTDTPYSSVYWYVKAPDDTSAYGSSAGVDWGDGVTRKSTMTTSFPDDVPGAGAFFEITAYVYRWDQSVYWESYQVWVNAD